QRARVLRGRRARARPGQLRSCDMSLQEQIRANRWRTLWLLVLFAILVGAIGAILGFAFNLALLVVVGAIGLVYAIVSWTNAGKMVAAVTGAQPADRAQYPRLY